MNIHTSEAINGGSTPKGGISSLYLEKCICAFLVASCHTPMGALKGLISPIAMAAVPIFFLISGYFLYSPSEEKSYERVKKSIKKIVPIFLIVQLFYWVWLMPNHGNLLNSWSAVADLFLTGTLFSIHLWYLVAMLQGMVVLGLFFYGRKGKYLWCLLPLHVLALVGGRYSFLITTAEQPEYLYYIYNSICYALPFMSAGYLIAKYTQRVVAFRHWGLLLSIFCTLGIGERLTLNWLGFGYANGPFLASGIIALCAIGWGITHRTIGEGIILEYIGERYSGNIYYFHIALATIIEKIFIFIGISSLYSLFGSGIVFMASLIVAYGIVWLQDKLRIHVLK